jgi:hypothetical protein
MQLVKPYIDPKRRPAVQVDFATGNEQQQRLIR